ncbi:DMT family transporter [Paludibacterium yongneupense]|uniref:DMT family transporter n=1 Tax=Paludibacterium yongneupense TaxID=400061 RepID=UPI000685BC72|nr:DMT family transporter [Paludibacterium yongneupense]
MTTQTYHPSPWLLRLWRVRSGHLGAGWMVVAALFFSLMSLFVKLGGGEFDPLEILFYRTTIGAIGLSGVMAVRRQSPLTSNWKGHATRTLVGYLSTCALFYALTRLPLATAVTLNYTSSLFFALTCMICLRERPNARGLLALLLGFVAIVWLLRPTFSADLWLAGLIGLFSGVAAGVANFQVRELGQMGEAPSRVVFWFFVLSSLAGLVVVLSTGGFHSFGWHGAAMLGGVGVCGLLGQLAMTRAYRDGGKFLVASFAYLTVAFSALWGFFCWGDALGVDSLAAIGLIVLSGVISARR